MGFQPGEEVGRLAQAWRLALDERPGRGPAGERLGRGTGSSLEFQDRVAMAHQGPQITVHASPPSSIAWGTLKRPSSVIR